MFARTNKNSWPEYSPSFRAVVKSWSFLLCRTCTPPSSRWAVAGCMHPKVAMVDSKKKKKKRLCLSASF